MKQKEVKYRSVTCIYYLNQHKSEKTWRCLLQMQRHSSNSQQYTEMFDGKTLKLWKLQKLKNSCSLQGIFLNFIPLFFIWREVPVYHVTHSHWMKNHSQCQSHDIHISVSGHVFRSWDETHATTMFFVYNPMPSWYNWITQWILFILFFHYFLDNIVLLLKWPAPAHK